jgi:hypothetical protein
MSVQGNMRLSLGRMRELLLRWTKNQPRITLAVYRRSIMRVLWIATICLVFSAPALTQNAGSEQPSRDDVLLYLRTMHSHDMMRRVMEVQSKSMQQMISDRLLKAQGTLPGDFDAHFKKAMDDLIKNMPIDEISQAMIPAYQQHFTKSDIEAMNAFYSSPVGQKVLEELPAVMQEGMQAAMPILSKYIDNWQERLQREFNDPDKTKSKTVQPTAND